MARIPKNPDDKRYLRSQVRKLTDENAVLRSQLDHLYADLRSENAELKRRLAEIGDLAKS